MVPPVPRPLPLTPNDEARRECAGELRLQLHRLTKYGRNTPLERTAYKKALVAIGQMLTRMDMDDVCIAVDELLHGKD